PRRGNLNHGENAMNGPDERITSKPTSDSPISSQGIQPSAGQPQAHPSPRRWPPRVVWLLPGVVFLAPLTVLIPGSPASLPNLLRPKGEYEGKPTSSWITALDAPDSKTRHHAIRALGAIGPKAPEAVPVLAAILTDDADPAARHLAAHALSRMYPASAE